MQINIDKKTAILLSVIGVLLVGLFLLGSKELFDREGNHGGNKMGGMHHLDSSDEMKSSDAMFLQMMIPHHEQAIVMSDLALKISKTPQILNLAKQIKAAQNPEITQMKNWLRDAGFGEDPGHSMDGMGGMLSVKELELLAKSSGKSFDKLFLVGMIEHHQGAIQMVNMISNSSNPEVKSFGQSIVQTQSLEIELMNDLLKNLN
ncbi:MAG: DUF305 domain-containing protein [Candidatus Nanopelagicus sp.]|jgi:uncharacterized protein (DUF305 family)